MAAHSEVGVHTAALTSVDCENGSISFWMRIKKCFMRREKVFPPQRRLISIRAYQNRNNDDKTHFPLSFRPPLNSTLFSLLHCNQKHPINDLTRIGRANQFFTLFQETKHTLNSLQNYRLLSSKRFINDT